MTEPKHPTRWRIFSRVQGRMVSTKAEFKYTLQEVRDALEKRMADTPDQEEREGWGKALPILAELDAHAVSDLATLTLAEAAATRREMKEKEAAGTLGQRMVDA